MKTILTLLCLALLYGVIACGSDDTPPTEAPTGIAQHTDSAQSVPTPMSVGVAENRVTPEPTVLGVTDDEPPTEQPTSHSTYIFRDHEGRAVASIEERLYLAEVVVRARLESASSDILTFNAVRYFKGTGPDRFAVNAETDGRDTHWDEQDAILFLESHAGADADFAFIDTTEWTHWHFASSDTWNYTGNLADGHTVGSRNPVWLPVGDTGGAFGGQSTTRSEGRSSGQSGGGTIVTEYDRTGAPETISPQELSDAISWLSGPQIQSSGRGLPDNFSSTFGDTFARNIRSGDNTDNTLEYSDKEFYVCITAALSEIRYKRDWEAYFKGTEPTPWPKTVDPKHIESGAPKGTEFGIINRSDDSGGIITGNQRYPTYWMAGQDANLFKAVITDGDNNSRNGYKFAHETRRPLPAGNYTYHLHGQGAPMKPCDYVDDRAYAITTVEVTAPPGTVHEAFFDPATTTAGVGYLATTSTSTGVLQPAGLSVRGRAIAITGLTWQNGRVVLTLDRFGSWLDGFSFIEPDGTVGLRLAEVDATKDWTARTLTWEVSEQPWEPGDELMMRMGPIPLPAVRNLTAEANSAGEVVLRWEVAYRAGVSGYRIWRHRPGRDEGPRIYVSDTLSTDTTYTDANSLVPNLTEYRVQAIDRVYNAGESSESVRVGGE